MMEILFFFTVTVYIILKISFKHKFHQFKCAFHWGKKKKEEVDGIKKYSISVRTLNHNFNLFTALKTFHLLFSAQFEAS